MAGVKGKSGGARPGAGRKPKPVPKPVPVPGAAEALAKQAAQAGADPSSMTDEPPDMLTLLQRIALGLVESTPIQVRAAVAAVQYTHTKRGDGGKKEEQDAKAKKAHGKFGAPVAPPRLAVVGGTKR